MMHYFLSNLLWADVNSFRSLGDRFNGRGDRFDSSHLLVGLMVLAAIGVGLYLLTWLRDRQERRRVYHSPRALFRDLCKAHQLDRSSRQLLKHLARCEQLDPPARLFLEPDHFEPPWRSAELAPDAEQLAALRDRLFAAQLEASPRRGSNSS